MQEAVADPGTHQYPSNRGRAEFREAVATSTSAASTSSSTPRPRSSPRSAPRSAIFNLNLAFLDPGDVALAADPGYPVYTGGPLLVGRRAGADAARCPSAASRPTSTRSTRRRSRARAKLMFLNYPNNPTGAVVPDGLLRAGGRVRARARHPRRARQRLHGDRPSTATSRPSFLETPGAKEVGVEVFSLSKGYNMTGWRCAAIVGNADAIDDLLAAEDEHRLGHVRGGAARRRRGAVARRRRRRRRDERASTSAAATSSVDALRGDRRRRDAAARARSTSGRRCPRATRARPRTASTCSRRPAVVVSPGARLRPQRRGLLPHLADDAGRAADRGGGADPQPRI